MTRLTVRKRWWLIAPVTVAVAATGLVVLAKLPSSSPGDPSDAILSHLRTVAASVPATAHVTSADYEEPRQDSCGPAGAASSFGWTPVNVDVQFSWTGKSEELLSSIGGVLGRSGWLWKPAATAKWADTFGSSWSWTRTLLPGEPAIAALFSDGDGAWELIAEAPAITPGACGRSAP